MTEIVRRGTPRRESRQPSRWKSSKCNLGRISGRNWIQTTGKQRKCSGWPSGVYAEKDLILLHPSKNGVVCYSAMRWILGRWRYHCKDLLKLVIFGRGRYHKATKAFLPVKKLGREGCRLQSNPTWEAQGFNRRVLRM